MDDGELAVVAHVLLNAASGVTGSITTVRLLLEGQPVDERVTDLLEGAERQALLLGESLRYLILGGPAFIKMIESVGPPTRADRRQRSRAAFGSNLIIALASGRVA